MNRKYLLLLITLAIVACSVKEKPLVVTFHGSDILGEPYKRIGYVSAKVDDLFNLLPARIGSFLMLLAGGILGLDLHNGRKIWHRDRLNHKSPNAGYPESAIAGLLDIQLGGIHTYFGEVLEKPTIGDPIRAVKVQDINDTCRVMYMSEFILLMMGIVLLLLLK